MRRDAGFSFADALSCSALGMFRLNHEPGSQRTVGTRRRDTLHQPFVTNRPPLHDATSIVIPPALTKEGSEQRAPGDLSPASNYCLLPVTDCRAKISVNY
jgi:hypothetical protein